MSTKFISATCPQCSGALQLPENLQNAKCSYCGANVVIDQNKNNDEQRVKNLLELAAVCQKGGSHAEAYEHYKKVLEIDSDSKEAWAGLGTSAGWQSNLISDRFDEMKQAHQKALSLSEEGPEKTIFSLELGLAQYQVAKALFQLSHEHTIEFISLRNAQFEHADRICRIIDICENAGKLNPELGVDDFISDIARRAAGILMLDEGTKKYLESKIKKPRVSQQNFGSSTSAVRNNTTKRKGNPALGCLLIIIFLIIVVAAAVKSLS